MGSLVEYPHAELTREIIGAAFAVHNTLGPGFLEKIYERALRYELELRGLSIQQQVTIPVYYRGIQVGEHQLDLIVDNKVIIELKAVSDFDEVHRTIAISYLTASQLPLALLINFGKNSLEHKRIVRSKSA